MVEFTGSAAASFSASHQIDGHLRCGRLHGHRWRVEVTIRAGQIPSTGDLHWLPELAEALEQFASELEFEDINAMLPGTAATPAGVALAVRERLVLKFPNITAVTVWMDEVSTTLHG